MREPLLLYAPPDRKIPVDLVKGVGLKGAQLLAGSKFGIATVQDLLQHYPRRHLDFSERKSMDRLVQGDEVTVFGVVKKVTPPPPSRQRTKFPLKVQVSDGSSVIEIAFFNQPWRAKQLRPGTYIAAMGKVNLFRGKVQMSAPMVDVLRESEEVITIIPQYPATADIHTAWLRKIIRNALNEFTPLADPLPLSTRERMHLMDRTTAMTLYHFPNDMAEKMKARERLVFDELFTLQVGLGFRKKRIESESKGITHQARPPVAREFVNALPFSLTPAQERSIAEIESDMLRSVPMHRLLQGEVGSGKTVVALYAALTATQGGFQAAIMAPTEVLATQHYLTISKLLAPLSSSADAGQMGFFGGPETVLLTGSVPAARKRQIASKIASGAAAIIVGTHALIQEDVEFANLGLAIIDEQHRFGVHQRMDLKEKARDDVTPDVLIMTATPIPRTLALTLYGDLDVSVIDEMPKGRKPVRTILVEEEDRKRAYDIVRSEVAKGHQAYVITPLVDESDKLQVKSAEAEAARLASEVFPDLSVGMMHGRLAASKKEAVMDAFRRGEIDVLISTTVVEVGVDVPNATVMLIEDADRFGLSQLHQLRGRIGRSTYESVCVLLSRALEEEEEKKVARERLDALVSSNDGFVLAQKDLELRGSGTLMGARQAGFSDLRLANLLKDVRILKQAREAAFGLIEVDPHLEKNPLIRMEMEGRFADRLEWLFNS